MEDRPLRVTRTRRACLSTLSWWEMADWFMDEQRPRDVATQRSETERAQRILIPRGSLAEDPEQVGELVQISSAGISAETGKDRTVHFFLRDNDSWLFSLYEYMRT